MGGCKNIYYSTGGSPPLNACTIFTVSYFLAFYSVFSIPFLLNSFFGYIIIIIIIIIIVVVVVVSGFVPPSGPQLDHISAGEDLSDNCCARNVSQDVGQKCAGYRGTEKEGEASVLREALKTKVLVKVMIQELTGASGPKRPEIVWTHGHMDLTVNIRCRNLYY